MRRSTAALLARAAAGAAASTSGRASTTAAASAATLSKACRRFHTRPPPSITARLSRGFAALPVAGDKAGASGPDPSPRGDDLATPTTPRSVSGHDREVTATDIGVPAAVRTARDVLQHAALVHFRESLEHESETRLSMPYKEAVELARACGVASSHEAAAAAVGAAHDAGLILRFQGTVFLRPSEVADLVLRALPDTDIEVRARLASLERQLEPYEKQKRAIDAAARKRSRRVLWAGLGALTAQWSLFAYLTWGHPHWGWDATEPFTYLTGQLLTIGAYAWFMYARRPLDPGSIEAHVTAEAARAHSEARGFDAAAHARLAGDVARYRRYLERQASHAGGGGGGGGGRA